MCRTTRSANVLSTVNQLCVGLRRLERACGRPQSGSRSRAQAVPQACSMSTSPTSHSSPMSQPFPGRVLPIRHPSPAHFQPISRSCPAPFSLTSRSFLACSSIEQRASTQGRRKGGEAELDRKKVDHEVRAERQGGRDAARLATIQSSHCSAPIRAAPGTCVSQAKA